VLHGIRTGFTLNPNFSKYSSSSKCELNSFPSIFCTLNIYISSGLLAVILLSNCLNEPAAALRAFANNSSSFSSLSWFISSKSFFDINTSPRTVISILSFISIGIVFTVFKFCVTSSPTNPFPLVAPLTNFPFLYSKADDNPSIFVSTTYFTSLIPFSTAFSSILWQKSSISSKLKTSCKLCKGTSCVTFSNPSFT